jgi:hypothetical protein
MAPLIDPSWVYYNRKQVAVFALSGSSYTDLV